MILEQEITRDKRGIPTAKVSQYKPSKKVKERIAQILTDFAHGYKLMKKPWPEFNDLSLIERQNLSQKSFNGYVPPKSSDPDENWKANVIRPIVRNRIISIAAHVTGALIYPQIFAQNDRDDEDKDAASVMRDLMEWAGEESNYPKTFLYAVIAALVNPASIIYTEYAEHYRTVKEVDEGGTWKEKPMLDEEYSGFQDTLVPCDELFIGDIYEHDIQRQPFVIWRKAIDYSQAVAKYGDNTDFVKYVHAGVQVMFDSASETFYEQEDSKLTNRLVEEVIYWNRTADLQIVMVNGVMLTDPDQPNPRKDKRVPLLKFGYELFDEGKFFYYRSLAQKTQKDEEVVNELYRDVINASKMKIKPPVAFFGAEAFNASITTPGTVTTFEDPNVKFQKIDAGQDMNAGLAALQKVEASISESSQDVLQSGQSNQGSQTAFEISRLEQNARIMLGLFAKMIGFGVRDYGMLRVSDIIQFLTVGEVQELTGGDTKLKYKSFLIPEKNVGGKKKTRKIELNAELPTEISDEERLEMGYGILDEEGGMDSDKEIYKVNPALFRELKFKVTIRPDIVTPPSDALKKALNIELYDRAIMSPYADQEQLYRDLLLGSYDGARDNTDKYVKEEQMMQPMQSQGQSPEVLNKLFGVGKNKTLNMAAGQPQLPR